MAPRRARRSSRGSGGRKAHEASHIAANPCEVGAAIAKVRAAKPGKVDALALEFLVLTAARGVEVRGAVWSEIEREERVWTVHREPNENRARAPCAAGRWRFSTRPGSWAAAGV